MWWLLLVGVVSGWNTDLQCDPTSNPKASILPAPWPAGYGEWGAATYCNPGSTSDGVVKGSDPNWMWGSMHTGTCYHGGEGAGSACGCTSVGAYGTCACVMQYHEDTGWCVRGNPLTCGLCGVGQYRTGCGCNGTITKV